MIQKMNLSNISERRGIESLDRRELTLIQCERLNLLLDEILPANAFYAKKLARIRRPIGSLDELRNWPFTTKEELIVGNQGHELAANLTYPLARYARFHQTSGTRGRPVVVLDTAEDWQWWLEGWQFVLDAAEVSDSDRVLMAFSFGPFIGFWSAYDAVAQRGALVIPTGGLNSVARLQLARTTRATVLCCTPSYALHLIEIAEQHQIDTAALGVRAIIVAGEPGGSVPSIRTRIEAGWQATLIDHAGATEVGPWGYGDTAGLGLFINEAQFIAEFVSLRTGAPAKDGELAELVLTTLGRAGSPVIRYRTGDLVRPMSHSESGKRFVFLEGGVLGRTDDMMVIRGVNIFPSSIEQILRSFPEVVEYRMSAYKQASMDQLTIEIEDRLNQPARVAGELQLRLGLNIEVQCVPLGSLPRSEAKGKRFIDRR
jgi:phenylacetate-CoA ligase